MPADEQERLLALHDLAILDTPREQAYDDVVKIAAAICRCPIAIVNFVAGDRQWGKALVGLDDSEAPREDSFCARTIVADDALMVVPDTLADPAWAGNPMVTGEPGVRFYAGAAITTPEGQALGSVCVADRRARTLDEWQLDALRTLARQTAAHLDLRAMAARLARANDELRRVAVHDQLTGLPNRELLHQRLVQELAQRRRHHGELGVLFCDLDGFKAINDEQGHAAGDEALQIVAHRLSAASRAGDTVARIAGDEFVVLCPRLARPADLDRVAHRLEDAVSSLPGLGISVGAVLAGDGDDPHGVLRRADEAMYHAKRRRRAGRGTRAA